MPSIEQLVSRIDGAFNAVDERIKKAQAERLQSHEQRQQRLEKFSQTCDRLREVWRPRLEALAQRFADRVEVTPVVVPARREAQFDFQSRLAKIRLRFSAMTNEDVSHVIFNYDLEILPIFMKFDSHSELAVPLDAIDEELVARWIDDRIVQFVETYLSLHENEYYLKDHLVEDPIAHVKFPRFAAGATLDWQGKTYYFIGEPTRKEFEQLKAKGA